MNKPAEIVYPTHRPSCGASTEKAEKNSYELFVALTYFPFDFVAAVAVRLCIPDLLKQKAWQAQHINIVLPPEGFV